MKNNINIGNIARSNLYKRKKTYLLLILAIFFAVFFSSTSVFLTTSAYSSIKNIVYSRYGYYKLILNNANDLPLDDLIDMGILSEYGITKTLGYALKKDTVNEGGFSIAQYDKKALKIANRQLIDGDFPDEKDEIAIESSVLKRIDIDLAVGDKITLNVAIPNGTGFLDKTVKKTYTISGILKNQYDYQMKYREYDPVYTDVPSAIVSDKEEIEAGGVYIYKCYGINGKNYSTQNILDLNSDNNSAFYNRFNSYIIGANDFAMGNQDPEVHRLWLSANIFSSLSIILLLATGVGIISAFTANVDQRKRQIGMLRAIGATRKQIFYILIQEAVLLTVITIPSGVISAILIVCFSENYLGEMFNLIISVTNIIGVISFAFFCVIISTLLPLLKASKIPPMQAIRDVDISRKLKSKRLKIIIQKNIGMQIARRNTFLYKNRLVALTILISLSVTIVIMGLGIGMTVYKNTFSYSFYDDYSIRHQNYNNLNSVIHYGYSSPGITEADKQDVRQVIGEGTVYGAKRVRNLMLVDELSNYVKNLPILNNDWIKESSSRHKEYLRFKEELHFEKDFISISCIGVDKNIVENLRTAVYEGELNMQKILSGEEIILMVPPSYGIDYFENGGYSLGPIVEGREYDEIYVNDTFHVGDELDISFVYTDETQIKYNEDGFEVIPSDANRIINHVRIGALIQIEGDDYFPFPPYNNCDIIMPFEAFYSLGYESTYEGLVIKLDYTPTAKQQKNIEDNLELISLRTENTDFVSYIEIAEEGRQTRDTIALIIVILFALFFIMSAGMINNTISSRIRSSKKMIGTIRAVGSSLSVTRKIFVWQLFYMTTIGIILGVILSIALYSVVAYLEKYYFDTINISLMLISLLVYIMLLFTICYLNIRISTRKNIKQSIVENIREF